jgi:lipoate-protein ligase A
VSLACLDLTLPTPAENLACDEALLEQCAAGSADVAAGGVLRFWESATPFVVLGLANRVAEEVNQEACGAAGVPILRRCSGGGTVLQGPGCLSYALVLPVPEGGPLCTITGSNQFIMQRQAAALAAVLGEPVTVEGHTDLAVRGRKVSGNAQRRRRDWLLFHGTFLLGLDPALMTLCLRPPPRQPAYRQGRGHQEFVTGLPVSIGAVKMALVQAWEATAGVPGWPVDRVADLVAQKYGQAGWNLCR